MDLLERKVLVLEFEGKERFVKGGGTGNGGGWFCGGGAGGIFEVGWVL